MSSNIDKPSLAGEKAKLQHALEHAAAVPSSAGGGTAIGVIVNCMNAKPCRVTRIDTPAGIEDRPRNIALDEWFEKTDWVQEQGDSFPLSRLGKHRADVLRDEIERLRAIVASAPSVDRNADCFPGLIEILEALRPNYGDVGSRDVDVTAKRNLIDRAIAIMRAAPVAQPLAPSGAVPIGYLPAYQLNRLSSGHDANLRSARFGPSPLDGDVAVYLAAQPLAASAVPEALRPTDDDLWDATLRDRDAYHDWADKLAEAIAEHFGVDIGEHSNENLPWSEALDAIESAAPRQEVQPAVPDGWQLVPIDPTDAILIAGQRCGVNCAWSYDACYRAMLAAAPRHEAQPDMTAVVETREYGAKLAGANSSPSSATVVQVCAYPSCNCPFDAPADPTWCARGLQRMSTPKTNQG